MKGRKEVKKMEWESKKEDFTLVDVRKLTNNFLPGLLKKAQSLEVGQGLCVVQSFEPKPLYSAMEVRGYERVTEKIADNEYRAYFYRTEAKGTEIKGVGDMPFKPTAILNYKIVDDELANNVMNMWGMTWEKENAAIDLRTKLLLSMSNAVGAHRYRQASREMIKAYALGVPVEVLDELFSLFAWNQGIGYFSSEIGPSELFAAYKMMKKGQESGMDRKAVLAKLMEKFGEKNPKVGTVSE